MDSTPDFGLCKSTFNVKLPVAFKQTHPHPVELQVDGIWNEFHYNSAHCPWKHIAGRSKQVKLLYIRIILVFYHRYI